jgi:hypothetical protein
MAGFASFPWPGCAIRGTLSSNSFRQHRTIAQERFARQFFVRKRRNSAGILTDFKLVQRIPGEKFPQSAAAWYCAVLSFRMTEARGRPASEKSLPYGGKNRIMDGTL